MPELVTIGETMVVFDSASAGPLRYASNYTCHTGGAETTVAVGVVRQGHTAGWISSLGEDEFGMLIRRTFMGEGVDLSRVAADHSRPTGIFFREAVGNGEYRNFYYRKNSAASAIRPDQLDEEYIASAKWLHLTGITMAVSESALETVVRAAEIAKAHGVKVCFDPNLRLKMWTIEQARSAMERIWPLVDVALPGAEEGELLFGSGEPDDIARELSGRGVGCTIVKIGADGAIGYENGEKVVSPGFKVKHVVDAFGAGDSFAAGIIAARLKGYSLAEQLRYANAIGAMAVSAPGNIEAVPTHAQVLKYLDGKAAVTR